VEVVVVHHTVEPLLNNSNNNLREVDTNNHPSNSRVVTVVSSSSLVNTVNPNRDMDKLLPLQEVGKLSIIYAPPDDRYWWVDPNRVSMLHLQVDHLVNRVDMLLLLVLPHLANSNSSMDSRDKDKDKDMASKVSLVLRVAVMEDTNPL
jgi:hypothetical protein